MKVSETELPGVLVIEPKVFSDERGFFYESYNEREFREKTGVDARFVQDNHSRSMRGVLRGLHYQIRHPQGKLVRVSAGEVFDAVVDIRKSSRTFGRWVAKTLSSNNKQMLWIPPGFAHGFLVMSETAELQYKTTDYWAPEYERSLAWNDKSLHIPWPLSTNPVLSPKDSEALRLEQAELFP